MKYIVTFLLDFDSEALSKYKELIYGKIKREINRPYPE